MSEPKGTIFVRCCVVGGGPAGVMLGYLLARAGHSVVVLEKHGDFLRDFRGDTVHPSTMTVLDELGLLDKFLARPHSQVTTLAAYFGNETVPLVDFSHVPSKTKFLAFMPQWEFLNFLTEQAKQFSNFTLLMNARAHTVVQDDGRTVGVAAKTPDGDVEIRADVVVAADGRHSTVREQLGVTPTTTGAPMDILWLRLSRKTSDPAAAFGYVGAGALFIMIDRTDYWQCGYVIPKGGLAELKSHGIEALRNTIVAIVPWLSDRVGEIATWDDVKLLEVAVDHLERWHFPGLLFIGDAAHAMSPIGGVGINLAIQDAVVTANILNEAFRQNAGPVPETTLARIQQRRTFPTRMTQALQVFIQKNAITSVLASTKPPTHSPALMWPMRKLPFLRWIPAYVVGVGFRPEHISR